MTVEFFRNKPDPGRVTRGPNRITRLIALGPETSTTGLNPDLRPAVDVRVIHGFYDYGDATGYRPDLIPANNWARPGDQFQLFGMHPSVIDEAFADYRMRAHSPTVLGMALNEANKVGMGVTYSDNLSIHSAKLVKKALELGIVSPNEDNPNADQTNDIAEHGLDTYVRTASISHARSIRDVATPEEVQAGRETARKLVRDMRIKKHMGPQFKNTNPEGWYQPKLGE